MDWSDRNFEHFEDFDSEVWDEEQWEKFMEEADRRVEDYMKLIEEEIKHRKENETDFNDDEMEKNKETVAEMSESDYAYGDNEERENTDAFLDNQEKAESFKTLPVWKIAYDFGFAVHDFVEKYYPGDYVPPEILMLCRNCFLIAAKIAGGHAMGYDKDVLEGNIAYCKRGLKAAENCLEALEKLRIKIKATPALLKLYGFSLRTRNAVREWIKDLRQRIWWR